MSRNVRLLSLVLEYKANVAKLVAIIFPYFLACMKSMQTQLIAVRTHWQYFIIIFKKNSNKKYYTVFFKEHKNLNKTFKPEVTNKKKKSEFVLWKFI